MPNTLQPGWIRWEFSPLWLTLTVLLYNIPLVLTSQLTATLYVLPLHFNWQLRFMCFPYISTDSYALCASLTSQLTATLYVLPLHFNWQLRFMCFPYISTDSYALCASLTSQLTATLYVLPLHFNWQLRFMCFHVGITMYYNVLTICWYDFIVYWEIFIGGRGRNAHYCHC